MDLFSWNIKKEKTGLLKDLKRLKQDKQALEADLGKMKTEKKPESSNNCKIEETQRLF
ncbi:hypothetical protein Cadr_000021480 [Camelus dromedarius]|uniref:Uncharacterized protein n=1 Tax=Camelus dromedarius TaxID=9838 RepID=A0A5N4CUT1_CAMDR|nr:hypothetical protein Cadr_000021480 [Camelus dromedarius]KAB1262578.1 hypothetical protein Cadr_000021480 [Camelus dromedarius]